ncbi:MAG: alpha-ketoacid dehydrogenase subunit beta [Acidimicrobiales bacterium]|nr:alpha-ketoacid dehydrogenase subunit beta [Acidimicrobiales bacterium]
MTATETTRVMMVREAINDALDRALASDDKVVLLGEDIADPGGGVYGITKGLSTKYGLDRVRPTPISEQAIVGAAIGAAVAGYRPVAEIMIMDFFGVCLDQVANHAAKLRYMSGGQTTVPLTIRCSAGAAMSLGAQHSQMLEAWLVHTPGLKVCIPSNSADAKGMLTTCIFDDDPCVFVEQVMGYFNGSECPEGEHRVPIGEAAIRREGDAITLVSYGRQMNDVLTAADQLAADGIDAEVIDLRWLQPLDTATILASVRKTGRLAILHEAVKRGGVGAEIAAVVAEEAFDSLRAPVVRIAGKNTPVPYARELEAAFLPTVGDLVAAARALVS